MDSQDGADEDRDEADEAVMQAPAAHEHLTLTDVYVDQHAALQTISADTGGRRLEDVLGAA